MFYSPERRTALVLCGTGAHGVYHAGVLRALEEAGVKIDIVAGQGMGAGGAALAAIGGSAKLWEPNGIWRGTPAPELYRWKWPVRAAAWFTVLLAAVLLTPLLFLAVALVVYPLGFLLEMVGADAGSALISWYSGFLQTAFAGQNLPTSVPRAGLIALGVLVAVLFASVALEQYRAPARRRSAGSWWWHIAGAPLEGESARGFIGGTLWQLIRGGAPGTTPARAALGRRYAEVLSENLGQPGFRELMLVATDLDTRRDIVGALLREPYREAFTARRAGQERQAEILDFAGTGRDHAADLIAGALTLPLASDPYLITFSADSYWRGETHRLCDRPGAVLRLLEELDTAGVTQAILVSAVPPTPGPHRLSAPRLDIRNRLGDLIAAGEATSLRDALAAMTDRFDALYLICPAHNPLGPFDFSGAYDEASDRRQTTAELMERAYEDAYRQFIEPVVGDSGEHLARATAEGTADAEGLLDEGDSRR